MYAFKYVRPAGIEEAEKALSRDGAMLLAGGQTLLPTLKQRLARCSALVDIRHLDDLKSIEHEDGALLIGAGVPHQEVADSPVVRELIPALASLADGIGDPQVRSLGTLGGSIANNDPAADYPAALLALDADIITANTAHEASGFFSGLFETALDPADIILSVNLLVPKAAAYRKFDQPASRFALTGVFVARFEDGVRVAVTGAGEDGVFRHAGLEAALGESFTAAAAESVEVSPEGLIEDLHGTAEYRANLIKVLAARAVRDCGG